MAFFRSSADAPAGHDVLREVAQGTIVADRLVKVYRRRAVVDGVSLTVRRGEAVGLLGPNGAGKTTMFYMISGLIAADEGRIFIDGNEVTDLPLHRRARLGIGYLPQEPSVFRRLTVAQNISAVLQLRVKGRARQQERLQRLLSEFGLERLRDSTGAALSGGERRRVELARALAAEPRYMLLDEPFAGVDPIAINDIRHMVRHLTDRGIGVLITDHNVRETLELVDRALIIYDGKTLTEGTPDEILANEDVRRHYLGREFRL